MKLAILGSHKPLNKRGQPEETLMTVPWSSLSQECKELECKNARANGSSRCQAHNKKETYASKQ